MFGRRSPTEYMQHERWTQSGRVRRRERELATERMSDLRWRWRNACSATPLAPMIYTPSGVTRAVPTIDHIDLGPPVRLRVRLRIGLTIADFTDAAPKIAPAMGVAAIRFTQIAEHWVEAVLLPSPGATPTYQSSESDRQPAKSGV
jgi:hypothetical protein